VKRFKLTNFILFIGSQHDESTKYRSDGRVHG